MALLKPIFMQAASGDSAITYSAQEIRAGLVSSIFSREGVLDKDAGHLRVTQRAAGANMSVDVAAGRCAIVGDDISDQGTYVCSNTTPVNLTVPTRPASGSRVHRVVARLRDKLSNGSWSSYEWVLEILADTGSGTPALPNSAITLALITVTSSTTSITTASNISDQRDRSSVGTPWLVGSLLEQALHTVYAGRDTSRPLTWTKNPDGWVTLAGWFRRGPIAGADAGVAAQTFWNFNGVDFSAALPLLPPEARPTGIRDVTMMTSEGPMHLAIQPDGRVQQRYRTAQTLTQGANGSWFSFDSITFRAFPFS